MTSPRSRRCTSPFARVMHGLVLLGWLLSSNGLAPAFTLAAATLDRCHRVKVASSSEGEVHVVLSHPGGEATHAIHEHSGLTTLMMMFAQPTGSPQSDHVLAFRAMEDLGRPSERDVTLAAMSVPALSLDYVLARLPEIIWRKNMPRVPKAPAWSPGVELKARKTLLQC